VSSIAAARPLADANKRAFLLKKLHSLTGVLPIGVFLIEHLWTNAKALEGEGAFSQAVEDIQALPFLPVIEIFGIFLPLAYHSLYGVFLTLSGKPNALSYKYARNWLYVLQRVTGFVALFFIGYHLFEYRIHKWLFGMRADAFYSSLSEHLSSTAGGVPWVAIFYLTGLAAVVFHFANGLSGFCFSWGVTVTRAAQRRAAILFSFVGATLFLLGAMTVLFFATGSRFSLQGDFNRAKGQVVPCPAAR
jgi:succinate dehydrogenase/fumarate reductase cytochrome b subunit (b558 family)